MQDKGYYGEYLYGRAHPVLSPRMDALGESLAMLFEIATPAQQNEMLKNLPLLDYGIPTVYPQTPGIPPYHNDSVWPFVQAFWNLAAARNHADAVVADGLSVLLRHTSFFLTNKENLVASLGSPSGTEINSDRQLWSIAGNLAMVYRILFGMSFQADGIHLAPFIPTDFAGSYQLDDLRFRQATLSIHVSGSGSRIRTQTLDGKPFNGIIPAILRGHHHVNLVLTGTDDRAITPHQSQDVTAPDTPQVRIEQNKLVWISVPGASIYQVYRDGKPLQRIENTFFPIGRSSAKSAPEYQVEAIAQKGIASFLSAPIVDASRETVLSAWFDKDHRPVELMRETPVEAPTTITVAEGGIYALRIRYANGSGPITTDNQCGLRSLYIDQQFIGVIVMPQRGLGKWDDWEFSNRIQHRFKTGKHTIELRMEKKDNNMNFIHNRVLVDEVEARRISPPQ
jgi:hypothetical protein